MKVTFNVKLTEKEMYSFLMNNTYRKPMGVIMFLFGIACFVVAAITFKDMDTRSILLLLLLGSLYTIIQPIMLYKNARKQIAKNPVYANELTYCIDDTGVEVSQGDNSTKKTWEEFWKACDFGKIVVIYIAVNNGIILPKAAIGDAYPQFKQIVNAHIRGKLR